MRATDIAAAVVAAAAPPPMPHREVTTALPAAAAAAAPAAAPAGGLDDAQQPQQPQQAHAASGAAAKPFAKYLVRRINMPPPSSATHVLFYAVPAGGGEAQLAVVGTDVRATGHFCYETVAGWAGGPPLPRCTHRARVLEYLATLGATEPVRGGDPAVTVPELAPGHWQQLRAAADPEAGRPALDRAYDGWEEDTGTLPDGRHFKRFFAVHQASGARRLMATAEDGPRRDRRYAYKAAPDFGGFAFENGRAVTAWLDDVVGAPRLPAPAHAQATAAAAAAAAAAAQGRGGGGGNAAGARPRSAGGPGRPGHKRGRPAAAAPAGAAAAAAAAAPSHAGSQPLSGAGGGGYGGVPSGLQQIPSNFLYGSSAQQQLQQQQLYALEQQRLADRYGFASGGTVPLAFNAGQVPFAPPPPPPDELAAALRDPRLTRWAAAAPTAQEATAFARWAARLRPEAIVDDLGGAAAAGGGGSGGGGGGGAVPASEALQLLSELATYQPPLFLILDSGMGRAVAALASRAAPAAVRSAAAQLAAQWREAATAVVRAVVPVLAADREAAAAEARAAYGCDELDDDNGGGGDGGNGGDGGRNGAAAFFRAGPSYLAPAGDDAMV